MKPFLLTLLCCSFITASKAQETTEADDSTFKEVRLNEIIISANKVPENKNNIAQQIMVLSGNKIKFLNQQTAATLLEQTGNIFVQKSQLGGGSPVIRGFEANKILLVVDGVKMNNAIFRSGHLQN